MRPLAARPHPVPCPRLRRPRPRTASAAGRRWRQRRPMDPTGSERWRLGYWIPSDGIQQSMDLAVGQSRAAASRLRLNPWLRHGSVPLGLRTGLHAADLDDPSLRMGHFESPCGARLRHASRHYLACLCGSIENYVGYQPGPVSREGWKPSAVKGLIDIVASCSDRRRFKDIPPGSVEEATEIVMEAAHLSMSLQDRDDSEFIGSGRMEILARAYFNTVSEGGGLRLRRFVTGEVSSFDGIFVGAPLWVRTVPHLVERAPGADHGGVMVVEVPVD